MHLMYMANKDMVLRTVLTLACCDSKIWCACKTRTPPAMGSCLPICGKIHVEFIPSLANWTIP